MIRLGIAPRFVDFSRGALATIDQWFNTVTARLNIYQKSGTPVLADVPESQWGLFRDTATGRVYLSANSAGILKSQEIGPMSVTAPASIAVAATLTAAQLLASLIQYTGAAAALTLPTGTLMDAAVNLSTDQGFDFYVINTGSGAATMTAGTGFTIVGSATVTNGTSAHYRARRTAANTYVAYRVS